MSNRKSVTPTWKELMEDLKPMTFGEKVDHLWTYYKEYLLVVFLVVVFIAFTTTAIVNSNRKSMLSGMIINISMSQKGYNYLTEDYRDYLGGDPFWDVVQLDPINFSSLADPTSSEDNYTTSMLLIARISGQMLDYALIDQFALEFYMTQDVFLDLTEFFTPEEMERLGERVIWAQPEPEDDADPEDYEEGELDAWAIAVDVTDLPFFQDNCGEEEKIYFTIAGNEPDMEGVRNLLDYIMAWEPAAE